MLSSEAASSSNQIAFDFMSDSGVVVPRAPAPTGASLSSVDGAISYLPMLGAVFALGVLAVAIVASTAGTKPKALIRIGFRCCHQWHCWALLPSSKLSRF